MLGLDKNSSSKSETYFLTDDHSYDLNQSLKLQAEREKLIATTQKMDSDTIKSVSDNIDYLGCVNGNCAKLGNPNPKPINIGDFRLTNITSNTTSNTTSKLNMDYAINIVYIVVLAILILLMINKRRDNLVQIIGVTIVYIFVKIYVLSNY